MILSPHEQQIKAGNPYAYAIGIPMFKHSFEIPNVGQVRELSNWLSDYEINYSIYPVADVVDLRDARTVKPMLLVAFDSEEEFASMFLLRWQ